MTLSDLQAAVYRECRWGSAPVSDVVTRILGFLNEGLRAVLSEPGLARLADSDLPLTFASVANQARYVLPEAVNRIVAIHEQTNDRTLDAMSLQDYRRFTPNPTTQTGTPVRYVLIGRTAVAVQPSDASEIFIKSTNAGDTGTVYLEGTITGGYQRQTSTTMTGVTAKSIDTTITSFLEISDFYLSANAVGTVTLLEDSGLGTELARITIGAKRPRYTALYLWPTPTAAITYYVDYRRELVDLANATDEPSLPTDFHPMLVAYGVAREQEYQGEEDRSTQAMQRFAYYLSRLKFATQSLSDELPVVGRRRIGHSRLGGFYPADTWTRG